ncbi:ABC transporter substrate-binding protein [Acuticoccus mangrovi]|uniref:ABC transporter substrate-binding protein n=1 Tax=Acuticoccus mangrovi TaxID=2796142 RepID=A0A934MGD4_9HYPH|nr:ABC transporter substrate-binding protein [Acuticoccus mangrovi]MBJ3774851.1 ABC transporter substrate-binding protein [Acuticoccus mangrovi]
MDEPKRTPTRRTVLKVTGAAAVTAAVGGLRPVAAIAQSSLELTTLRSTSKSWLWAAEDYANAGGFFDKAGVKVNSNASNRGTNVAALQGGGVDIVLGSPGEAMRARSRGLKIKSFIATVNRYASHIVIKQDLLDAAGLTEASPVEDKVMLMKGKKLGTTGPGAAPDALFRYLAVSNGLNPERDMQLVSISGGGQGMLAALGQDAIQGFCLSSPTSDMAVQRQGCGYLFNMATNPPPFLAEYQYIGATTGEETIAKKRDALVAYCKGIALALTSINEDPDAFKTWATEWFGGMEPSLFDAAFANNSKIYATTPVPSEELFKKNVEFIDIVNKTMGAEPVPDSLNYQTFVDPTISQEAVSSL